MLGPMQGKVSHLENKERHLAHTNVNFAATPAFNDHQAIPLLMADDRELDCREWSSIQLGLGWRS